MHQIKKLLAQILVAVVLTFSIIDTASLTPVYTAEAAVKAPSVKVIKKTLYAGYQNYKVELKNLSADASITYKSSNPKVASIDNEGTVTPLMKGNTIIYATIRQNNKTYNAKVTITVKNPYVNLTSYTESMNVGDSFVFIGRAYGTGSKVVWSVSDDKIAMISSQGKLTALAAGKVTVTATSRNAAVTCDVFIGTNRIGTFLTDVTCCSEKTLWVTLTDPLNEEKLNGDTESGTLDTFDYEWGEWTADNTISVKITPKKAGKDALIIRSSKTTDGIRINVTVTDRPADKKSLAATEVYSECGPSTVEINVTSDYLGDGLGSGFFIGNGMIVTNYHVIEGADKIIVTTYDKKQYQVNTILGYNKYLDLAVLGTDIKDKGIAISQDSVLTGSTIYALGSPFGLTGTLSNGMVSTASRVIDGVDYIQLTASISPGNSGGPLLNEYGEVVGVNTMYYENGQNLNFAININELYKVNTNYPVSVTDYYKIYMESIKKKFADNIISEDTALSKDPKDCQYVGPWTGVKGNLIAGETGDYYRFTVQSPINFAGMILSDNVDNRRITSMELYDYNSKCYATAQDYEDKTTKFLYYPKLSPGEYYVKISTESGYTGEDVPYLFILGYEDAY